MKKLFTFVLLFFVFLYASPCNSYQRDKAEYLAEQFGEKFVNEIGGGQDIVVNLEQCDYNIYSRQFRLKIDITWDGIIFSSNHYEVEGILKLNDDETGGSFAKTWSNQKFKDLQFWKKLIGITIGGIIILNDMSEQNNY